MSAVDQLYAADMVEIVLDLPVPPSVNKLRRGDTGVGARLRKAFYRRADMHIMAARGGTREPLPVRRLLGPYEAIIQINEKLSHADLDNHVKCLIDYAVNREFVPNDNPRYLRRLVVEWGCPINGARITLRSVP
jgi:hypothetical protein